MKIIYALIALLSVSVVFTGCGPEMGTSPKVSYSGFDNARTVSISPHGTIKSQGTLISLGADWTEANPDSALLVVEVLYEYTGITGLELNIDGKEYRFKPTESVTQMTEIGGTSEVQGLKNSQKAFVASLDAVRKILNSNRTWMRIDTPTGTAESAVNDGTEKSKAFFALKRFMSEVRNIEAQ